MPTQSSRHRLKRDHATFHIATANLLNLALPNRIYYAGTRAYDNEGYKQKISGIAQLLNNAKSDIIALQEVWDEQALITLALKLGFNKKDVLAPLASNDPTSIYTQGRGAQNTPAQGIISRFDIINWQVLQDFDPLAIINIPDQGEYRRFNRPPLVATLSIHNQPVTVISTHLKSKRPHYLRDENGKTFEDYDDPLLRVRAKLRSLCMRAAEAVALRIFIINHLKDTHHPLILLGDMNDVTNSVTTQLLAETSEVAYDKSMRDVALFDAAQVQTDYGWTKNMAYTHLYQGMPEVIDQLFVSEEFLLDSKYSLGEVVKVDYFNDHLKWEFADRVSDHGIVRAQIAMLAS